MPGSSSCNGHLCHRAVRCGYPLSAAPTLWARSRAVIESGGGRPPCRRPLGGGRASLEGAQQPSGLELGSFGPHSHDMPGSPALCLALCPRRRRHKSRAAATNRISSTRTHPQAVAVAAQVALVRICGPRGRWQRRSRRLFFRSENRRNWHGVNGCVTWCGGAGGGLPRPERGRGVYMGRTT